MYSWVILPGLVSRLKLLLLIETEKMEWEYYRIRETILSFIGFIGTNDAFLIL